MFDVYAWEMGGNHHGWRQSLQLCLLMICRRYHQFPINTISTSDWDSLVAMEWSFSFNISAAAWKFLVAISGSNFLGISNLNWNQSKTNPLGIPCILNCSDLSIVLKLLNIELPSL